MVFLKIPILGVPFSNMNMEETVQWIKRQVDLQNKVQIVTANPEMVMEARKNAKLFQLLKEAPLVTPDGVGIVWAAKKRGTPMQERVSGYDLLHRLMKEANANHWRVFLFGASEEVNRKAAERLAELYSEVQFVGRRNGFFSEEDESDRIREINEQKPHILLVGLGAPKQELWLSKVIDELNVNAAMGVGGSFDVLAGKVKRAPVIWQQLHLEWLYRLVKQPSRWRRQLALPAFVWHTLRDKNGNEK